MPARRPVVAALSAATYSAIPGTAESAGRLHNTRSAEGRQIHVPPRRRRPPLPTHWRAKRRRCRSIDMPSMGCKVLRRSHFRPPDRSPPVPARGKSNRPDRFQYQLGVNRTGPWKWFGEPRSYDTQRSFGEFYPEPRGLKWSAAAAL